MLALLRIAGVMAAEIGNFPPKLGEALREVVHVGMIRFRGSPGVDYVVSATFFDA